MPLHDYVIYFYLSIYEVVGAKNPGKAQQGNSYIHNCEDITLFGSYKLKIKYKYQLKGTRGFNAVTYRTAGD